MLLYSILVNYKVRRERLAVEWNGVECWLVLQVSNSWDNVLIMEVKFSSLRVRVEEFNYEIIPSNRRQSSPHSHSHPLQTVIRVVREILLESLMICG